MNQPRKSKYGVTIKRQADGKGTKRGALSAPNETRDGAPDVADAEQEYASVADKAPVLLAPGRQRGIALFASTLRARCLVDFYVLGSSADSVDRIWLRGRYDEAWVMQKVSEYIAYLRLAVIYPNA